MKNRADQLITEIAFRLFYVLARGHVANRTIRAQRPRILAVLAVNASEYIRYIVLLHKRFELIPCFRRCIANKLKLKTEG